MQLHFKSLQDTWTILVYLQETIVDKVLIFQRIIQFNKPMDLNKAVDDRKKTFPENMEDI